ncbi:MAG TPA: CBS domain-containing protein [Planctomycetota bacterium]|nr:CBS domain-containing protein [Planctomycetota bacterium]
MHPQKNPLSELTAGEIMQPSVISVSRRTPIAEVARTLAEHRISGCPVTDEAGQIVGVVSLRNLVERYAEGADREPVSGFYDAPAWDTDEEYGLPSSAVPDTVEDVAADVMSGEVYAVEKTATVPEVARTMMQYSVHRLLVRHRGQFIGLVSSTDVLRAVAAL